MNHENGSETRLFVEKQPHFGEGFDLRIRVRSFEGGRLRRVDYAQMMLNEIKPGEYGVDVKPTFSLSPTEAQWLIDELWHVGLRPTEGTGSAGAYAAQTRHLEDMRSIVFKLKPQGNITP